MLEALSDEGEIVTIDAELRDESLVMLSVIEIVIDPERASDVKPCAVSAVDISLTVVTGVSVVGSGVAGVVSPGGGYGHQSMPVVVVAEDGIWGGGDGDGVSDASGAPGGGAMGGAITCLKLTLCRDIGIGCSSRIISGIANQVF